MLLHTNTKHKYTLGNINVIGAMDETCESEKSNKEILIGKFLKTKKSFVWTTREGGPPISGSTLH